MGEISIGVDFIADYFLHYTSSTYPFALLIVVATLEERVTAFDRDLSNDSNCGRHITKTINLTAVPSTIFVLHFIVHIHMLSSNHLIHEYHFFWVCNVFMKLDISCLHLLGFNFLHNFKR